MDSTKTALLAGALILLVSTVPASSASQTNLGFVTYDVTIVVPYGQHSALVNETVRTTDKPGFSVFILQVISQEQNLTYSRLVNVSQNLLPYLPSLPNQTLNYANGMGYSVHLSVTTMGTTVVTFLGSQYSLNEYAISADVSYGNRTLTATGEVHTFDNGLIYSASLSVINLVEFRAILKATNLPLVGPPSQVSMAAYVGTGLGLGGTALLIALLIRRRKRVAEKREQKPMHWVD